MNNLVRQILLSLSLFFKIESVMATTGQFQLLAKRTSTASPQVVSIRAENEGSPSRNSVMMIPLMINYFKEQLDA